jgi:glycosyltransferase involved in cell wall biosynthesis
VRIGDPNERLPDPVTTGSSTPELSVIVLCYRAGESLKKVIEPLHELLVNAHVDFELVLVANYWPGQRDPTPAVARAFARTHDHARVVAEPKEGAMGWDMRCGLEHARGDHLVIMDGDAQNPVEDALLIFRRIRASNADVMKGRRVRREDGPYRRFVSLAFNLLFAAVFRTRGLWDINGKPKALTRAAYSKMNLRSDDWFIDAEIVLQARGLGLRVEEMPVVFHENEERSSFVHLSAIWEFLRNMTRFRVAPRRWREGASRGHRKRRQARDEGRCGARRDVDGERISRDRGPTGQLPPRSRHGDCEREQRTRGHWRRWRT